MGNNDETVDSRGPGTSGATIGDRYQLGTVLGRGAMSTVYRAKDLLLGREVAVKLFLPGSGDESFRVRQETEMRLLAAFDHPGLVAAFDAGVDTRNDEERAYLVMELAQGRDLRAVLSEGPLSVPETSAIGTRLAGALAQVHEHGVIHRDIKPANILVSDESGPAQSVKLADFGVALVMDDNRLTATGFTVGTAQYLSPEQAQGLHLTPASDIYSLGLVLLECLTGKAEYPGTPVETASARLHRAPEIPEDLPSGLRGLLRAMTDMDPEGRPKAADVEDVLAGRRRKLPPGATAVLPVLAPPQAGLAEQPQPAPPQPAPQQPEPTEQPEPAAQRELAHLAPAMAPHAAFPHNSPRSSAPLSSQSAGLPSRAERRRRTSAAGTFGKRHPRVVGGVVAAAVTVPVALALLVQNGVPSERSAEPTQPVDPKVSIAESQPSAPTAPIETAPADAVPADAVNVPETGQTTIVPVPVQPVPAPADNAGNALPGKDLAVEKSDGKSETKSEKGKGNGRD
ncbi:serine/threonine-protein kinase [Paenarthrobacter sp. NPDC089322]|uniref:serine/threonine-protein kinase n=1 Tax=Paenarthrobacter sp. NPDC089322 TaxID=3155065 RepID=UPI003428C328